MLIKTIITLLLINCFILCPLPAKNIAAGKSDCDKSALSPKLVLPTILFPARFTREYLNFSESSLLLSDSGQIQAFSQELGEADSEQDILHLVHKYIRRIIPAEGVTVYTLNRSENKIIYRNIWREGMEGIWHAVWKELPAKDEKSRNINTATLEKPYLYISSREKSPLVYSPWLLKDVFMYRFGAKSFLSRAASNAIDHLCQDTDLPARLGLSLIKILRPQWLNRVNESLNITILDRNSQPIAQILINNWKSGQPLFAKNAEKDQKLEAVTSLTHLSAIAIQARRHKHYLELKAQTEIDLESLLSKLKAIRHIYKDGVSRSIHSSKNYISTGIPGYGRLILKKMPAESDLRRQLEPLINALIKLGEETPMLEKFERHDIKEPLRELEEVLEDTDRLLPGAKNSDLFRDIKLEINSSLWSKLTSLYFHASNQAEADQAHKQAVDLLQNNPGLLSEEYSLYRFISRAIAIEKTYQAQQLLEKNLSVISGFTDQYLPIYDQARQLLTRIEEIILLSPEAADYQERLNNFINIYAKPFIKINGEFFSLIDNLDSTSAKVDLKPVNLSILLAPYRSPLEILANGVEKKLDVEYSFSYQVPDNLWTIADPTEFNLVMDNLFSNAVKYSDQGGRIEISAFETEKEIDGRSTPMVAVRVKDQGRGIAEENIVKVGTMHERLGMEAQSSIKGSGIGLSYVKKVLEKMGGIMEVTSPGLGKGSVFTIYLPRPEQEAIANPSVLRNVRESPLAPQGKYLEGPQQLLLQSI